MFSAELPAAAPVQQEHQANPSNHGANPLIRPPAIRRALSLDEMQTVSNTTHGFVQAPFEPGPRPCYSKRDERFASMRGSWTEAPATNRASYWNLSCPMEWSKYSCVHQGAHAHAEHSQKLTFEPSACSLPDIGMQSYALPRGRRIVFIGDSLIRQVFIAFACLLSPHVEKLRSKVAAMCAGWREILAVPRHSELH